MFRITLVLVCIVYTVESRVIGSEMGNEILPEFRNGTVKKIDFQTADIDINDVIELVKQGSKVDSVNRSTVTPTTDLVTMIFNATEEAMDLVGIRQIRQNNQSNEVDIFTGNSTSDAMNESQESEEDTNMVTGLISAFLGGLSRPDGGVDLEALIGLLGTLSTQRDDGTYDFNGLTELLRGFFGGDEEGGSDFAAFVGGLAGAFIKGVANPPGARGTGMFLGKIAGGVLPALFAPAPPAEGADEDNKGNKHKPEPPVDLGGFIFGLLTSLLGSGSANSSNTYPEGHGGGGSKFSLFKGIFSIISSIFTSASGFSSGH